MRLHAYTLDEREAMKLRSQGWAFKSFSGSEWELTWPSVVQCGWPPSFAGEPDPTQYGSAARDAESEVKASARVQQRL